MFDSGQCVPDEEESAASERREQVKRVVSRIDPQWADLFDRAANAIARSRRLQTKLSEVLTIAARFLARKQ